MWFAKRQRGMGARFPAAFFRAYATCAASVQQKQVMRWGLFLQGKLHEFVLAMPEAANLQNPVSLVGWLRWLRWLLRMLGVRWMW